MPVPNIKPRETARVPVEYLEFDPENPRLVEDVSPYQIRPRSLLPRPLLLHPRQGFPGDLVFFHAAELHQQLQEFRRVADHDGSRDGPSAGGAVSSLQFAPSGRETELFALAHIPSIVNGKRMRTRPCLSTKVSTLTWIPFSVPV